MRSVCALARVLRKRGTRGPARRAWPAAAADRARRWRSCRAPGAAVRRRRTTRASGLRRCARATPAGSGRFRARGRGRGRGRRRCPATPAATDRTAVRPSACARRSPHRGDVDRQRRRRRVVGVEEDRAEALAAERRGWPPCRPGEADVEPDIGGRRRDRRLRRHGDDADAVRAPDRVGFLQHRPPLDRRLRGGAAPRQDDRRPPS